MTIKRSAQIQAALFAIALIYSFFMAFQMPNIVPTHWNAAGQIDAYGSKWMNLLIMPGVIAFLGLLTFALPKLSPDKVRIEPFERTYSTVMVLVSALMFSMHVVIVEMSSGAKWDIGRIMMAILFISLIFIGNLMPKIRPNFYMGVRTPWTLADERVWRGTHRFAAKIFVFGSLIGLVLSLIGVPYWISFSYFMAICLLPIVQSYVLYQRLHR